MDPVDGLVALVAPEDGLGDGPVVVGDAPVADMLPAGRYAPSALTMSKTSTTKTWTGYAGSFPTVRR